MHVHQFTLDMDPNCTRNEVITDQSSGDLDIWNHLTFYSQLSLIWTSL